MAHRLVAGTFSPSVLLDVARTTGRLADAGLEVDEVPVASSPGQFRSLVDGEIDVAFTSPDNVLAYRFSPRNPLGGVLDVGIVNGVDRGLGLALYARPGFDGSLRGARVGVDVPVSGFALAMYALTESLGVPRGEYELLTLGSTPRRLTALLAGDCDVTMLNAGNELVAEEAGCVRLAAVADVCAPYLGTVTAVAGSSRLEPARALGTALAATIADVRSGAVDDVAVARATVRLDISPVLARRYVDRLRDDREGLLPDAAVDPAALETVAALRRRFLPDVVDGVDVLARPLDAVLRAGDDRG
jgi:ABC-type nitrate/sulfonate/bicarbonate transport system substrate-binding protein